MLATSGLGIQAAVISRRRRRRLAFAFAAALITAAILPVAVFADGDPPKLEVDPPRVAAGGAVTVHGIDLPDPGAVSLELIDQAGASVALGFATADDEGTFWHVVTVPAITRPGPFVLRAVDGDGEAIDVPLQVGPAAQEPGEQRGADEPLLVPLSSLPTGPATQPVAGSSPVEVGPAADAVSIVVAIGMALVVASVLAGLIRIRSRRSSAAPTGTRDLP